MAEVVERYVYRLDAMDNITFVNRDCLRFACENEAPELTREGMVGKSIWNYIAGEETRRLYERLFHYLRAHRAEIIVPFRCDSPDAIREMNLTLRSLMFGGIECEGRMVHIEKREPVKVLSRWTERSNEEIDVCSVCRRLHVDESWTEIDSAIVKGRLLNHAPAPRLRETVCPACEHAVEAEIKILEKLLGKSGAR